MPSYTTPLRDMHFVLHDVFGAVDQLKAKIGPSASSAARKRAPRGAECSRLPNTRPRPRRIGFEASLSTNSSSPKRWKTEIIFARRIKRIA